METRVRELRYRMMITDLLRVASKSQTYQELSNHLGLSPPILSRYMRGHVLPSFERAQELYEKLMEITNIKEALKRRITFDEDGYIDNTPLVSEITWLKIASNYALERFAGRRVSRVLTSAVDGVPVATLVASLLEVNLVVAKERKEVGISEYLERSYIPRGSAIKRSLYIPKASLKRKEDVLIIDDVVRTGEKLKCLIEMVKEAKAEVAGIYVVIAVGEEWRESLKEEVAQHPFEVFLELKQPQRQ